MNQNLGTPQTVIDRFLQGYIGAALWTSLDTDGEEEFLDATYSMSDMHPDILAAVKAECLVFIECNWQELCVYADKMPDGWGSAGHDFWLTRNHHGAGFWDRGLGKLGDKLTAVTKLYRDVDLYVGVDKKLYMMGFESAIKG